MGPPRHGGSPLLRRLRRSSGRPRRHGRLDEEPPQHRGHRLHQHIPRICDVRRRRSHVAGGVPAGKARSGNVRGDQPIRAGRHRRHRGRAFLRARRRGHPRYRARLRQQPARRRPGRRFHHHPTARAQHRVVRRGDRHLLRAQDPRGRAGHRFGETLQQRRHPGQVLEHHQLRGRLLRHRSGRAELLPGVGTRPDARAGRHARRHPAVAHLS